MVFILPLQHEFILPVTLIPFGEFILTACKDLCINTHYIVCVIFQWEVVYFLCSQHSNWITG